MKFSRHVLPLALSVFVTAPVFAQTNPALFSAADNVSAEDTNKVIEAKVWLHLRNEQALDSKVAEMYRPGSPSYHHWSNKSDLQSFFPAASDLAAVRQELEKQGLTVTRVGPHNMFVNVQGTVGTMQSAFHTEIRSLSFNGKTLRATTAQPTMSGGVSSMVAAVSGLSESMAKNDLVKATDPDTGKPFAAVPVASPQGIVFSGDCFRGIQSHTFRAAGGKLPIATYTGNRYGQDITNTVQGTLPPCGYDAANVTGAYGLNAAFAKGLDGAGQTIVIVDANSQPTIEADANLFSKINGLPPLNSSNFKIYTPLGKPTVYSAGGAEETSLDVEWAHALAPQAKIALVLSPTLSFTDLEESVFFAIANQLGSVISNSYGAPEALVDPSDLKIEDSLSKLGAALGISVNYSSGDDGDFVAATTAPGMPGVKTVSAPSDSPYSTSVGGTSLAITSNNKLRFQTGWGNNLTRLATVAAGPLDPPVNLGFNFGAGGGQSDFFKKPGYQKELPGKGRQQPDVSLVADPYTGVEIIVTLSGQQDIEVIGGTSLSCPAFSAIWAIANQRAGQLHGKGSLLSQAAPIVASLAGTSSITDVLPYSTPTNVSGIVIDANGPTFYSPDDLAAPLENTTHFLSALYNSPFSGSWFDLTFGTDSSLVVKPGWDNVTGYGTPNGLTFIDAAAK